MADAAIIPTCTLGRGKANIFLDGNPIVYSGAIETTSMSPATGDPVIVVDHVGAVVAWGVYNSDSMYKVRVLQMAWEVDVVQAPNGKKGVFCDVAAVVSSRIAAAAALRVDLGIASGGTDVYRLVNSEGDRLSGVCVDVYGGESSGGPKVAVASVSAAWADFHRDDIVKALGEHAGVDAVVWRVDAKMLSLELGGKKRNSADDEEEGKGWSEETESGADGDDVDTEDEEAAAPADAHVKSASEEVTTYCYDAKTGERCPAPTGLTAVMEGGVKYAVDLERG